MIRDINNKRNRKGTDMLDLIPYEETAAAKAKARGGDIWVTHRNIEDVSLYEKYGKIRRVPIEALTSTPDLTPSGEVIGFIARFTSTTSKTCRSRKTASGTRCAAGWTCSTLSICLGPCKSSRVPTVTFAAILWCLVARRHITSGRFTGARYRRKL